MKIGWTNSEFIEIDTIYCLVGHKIKQLKVEQYYSQYPPFFGTHFTALIH